METPTFDWLDEGESWNALGTDLTAKVEIKDGAICLIITDSNNDGVITIADRDPELKNDPDTPGKVLRVNIDDDDMDVVLDKWQRPNDFNVAMNPAALADSAPSVTVQNEDDLAELILYVWIECLEKENGDSLYFDVYSVFPNDLVMWTAETKGSRIHRGVEVNERITEQTRLATLSKEDGKNIFTHTVYMEANASLVGTVVLIAQPVLNTPIGSG
ncbi:MAG: hypothetical protein LBU65_09935, partial [Planctomycetaceae bacterium]|nr:hypothetical protein [Planctomycetaceae bacterium]